MSSKGVFRDVTHMTVYNIGKAYGYVTLGNWIIIPVLHIRLTFQRVCRHHVNSLESISFIRRELLNLKSTINSLKSHNSDHSYTATQLASFQ